KLRARRRECARFGHGKPTHDRCSGHRHPRNLLRLEHMGTKTHRRYALPRKAARPPGIQNSTSRRHSPSLRSFASPRPFFRRWLERARKRRPERRPPTGGEASPPTAPSSDAQPHSWGGGKIPSSMGQVALGPRKTHRAPSARGAGRVSPAPPRPRRTGATICATTPGRISSRSCARTGGTRGTDTGHPARKVSLSGTSLFFLPSLGGSQRRGPPASSP